MLKLFRKGGIEAIKNAKWGRGGLRDPALKICEVQKDWAIS